MAINPLLGLGEVRGRQPYVQPRGPGPGPSYRPANLPDEPNPDSGVPAPPPGGAPPVYGPSNPGPQNPYGPYGPPQYGPSNPGPGSSSTPTGLPSRPGSPGQPGQQGNQTGNLTTAAWWEQFLAGIEDPGLRQTLSAFTAEDMNSTKGAAARNGLMQIYGMSKGEVNALFNIGLAAKARPSATMWDLMNESGNADMFNNIQGAIGKAKIGINANPGSTGNPTTGTSTPAAASGGGNSEPILDELSRFYASLTGDLANDPRARQIANMSGQQALSSANAAGVRGGLSGASQEQASANALSAFDMQRRQLALQGLGAMNSRDLGLRSDTLARLQAQNAANEANYQNNYNRAASQAGATGDAASSFLKLFGVNIPLGQAAATTAGNSTYRPSTSGTPGYGGYQGGFGGGNRVANRGGGSGYGTGIN